MNATPFKIHNENEFLYASTTKMGVNHALKPSGLNTNAPKSIIFEENTPFKDHGSGSAMKNPKSNRKALSNLSTSQINSRATPGMHVQLNLAKIGPTDLRENQQLSHSIHKPNILSKTLDHPVHDSVRCYP